MNSDPARPIIMRLRRRMLLVLGRGTAPLSRTDAYALLPDLAARFAANDDLASPQGEAFFAALNADPDLAESFSLLAEATATIGAIAPAPSLAARLTALPYHAGALAPPFWWQGTFGQPIAVARIVTTWQQRPPLLPPPGAASAPPARLLREDATPPYELHASHEAALPSSYDPPTVRLTDPAGVQPPVDLVLTARQAATTTLTLQLYEPATTTPSAHAWRVTAHLGQHDLAGTFTAPANWELSRPLMADEFASLTIVIHPR